MPIIRWGGDVGHYPLTSELELLARRSTAAIGLDMAGVDIILTDEGPCVLEVNANPGWEGIAQTFSDAEPDFYDRFLEILEADNCSWGDLRH